MTNGAKAAAALALAAGVACAQTQDLVFTQANDEPASSGTAGTPATAPHVGVGFDAVVVAANRRLAIYNKLGTQLQLWDIATATPAFPFQVDPAHSTPFLSTMLFDPQAGYDPIANRLWMLYLEGVASDNGTPGLGIEAHLHLAVSRDPSDFGGGPLNTLADTHWWYYTHDTGTGTKAGAEYDLATVPTPYAAYKGEAGHREVESTVRFPSVAFDEQAIIVAVNETDLRIDSDNVPLYPTGDSGWGQFIYIIPRDHAGGSITDGDRPAEGEIAVIYMEAPETASTDRVLENWHFFRAVQEPFPNPSSGGTTEQVENATFFISMASQDDSGLGLFDSIRLRGFYDADPTAATDWTMQQQTVASGGSYDLLDVNVGQYAHPTTFPTMSGYLLPDTPDTAGWEPNAYGGYFQTAVLARDVNNDFRIFAIHAIQEGDASGPFGHWIVQWYVIDPHLPGFGTTPDGWQPSIVAQGRLHTDGDRYHPVIVVNRQGQAFIEYTYSNATSVWPEVRRARLDSTYTAVVSGSETQVQYGPNLPYTPLDPIFGNWADYADAQADPFDTCRYWSIHTLVSEPDNQDPTVTETDERDVWLFRQLYGSPCFQSNAMLDLNDDGQVDMYDMAAFGPLFDRGARRVDIDGSGEVDATDMALFFDAYDGYTRRR